MNSQDVNLAFTYPVDIMLRNTNDLSSVEKFFEYVSLGPHLVKPKTSTSMMPQTRNMVNQSKKRFRIAGRLPLSLAQMPMVSVYLHRKELRTARTHMAVLNSWLRALLF